MSETQNYITKVHLRNYKSIVDASIDFKPGLNVIIGKNGSGKTNLMEGIDISLEDRGLKLEEWPTLSGELNIFEPIKGGPVDFDLIRLATATYEEPYSEQSRIHNYLQNMQRRTWGLASEVASNHKPNQIPPILQLFVNHSFIRFSSPDTTPFLDNSEYGWSIGKESTAPLNFDGGVLPNNGTYFLGNRILRSLWDKPPRFDSESQISDYILAHLSDFITLLAEDIVSYSPINGIEAVKGAVERGNLEGRWVAKGFRFRFKIHDHFLPFSQLSDGTKRILRILIEAIVLKLRHLAGNQPMRLLMIEEPELGIHPHQLHLLMLFLKEKAKSMQIILTTHSPQVLDILDSNELDRIIISDFDPKKGSQFRHLNQQEVEKAQAYMKDMQLSDYWRFSDLETR